MKPTIKEKLIQLRDFLDYATNFCVVDGWLHLFSTPMPKDLIAKLRVKRKFWWGYKKFTIIGSYSSIQIRDMLNRQIAKEKN